MKYPARARERDGAKEVPRGRQREGEHGTATARGGEEAVEGSAGRR